MRDTNNSASPPCGEMHFPSRDSPILLWLFSVTIFLGSGLLFMVQPMTAKILLPYLGGAPAVWNTCMVFFQFVLLAGYAYAHVISTHVRYRNQAFFHLALLVGAWFCLPIHLPTNSLAGTHLQTAPISWLLYQLIFMVGLPFFALSAGGTLFQKWFSNIGHKHSADPYFLYLSSNLGSLLALFAYPVLMEPFFPLLTQGHIWKWLFGALIFLVAGCGWVMVRSSKVPASSAIPGEPVSGSFPIPSLKEKTFWVVLSFIPSSLMLGVTTYLANNIAAVPLLWIIPLAIYLLTFILAFAQRQVLALSTWVRILQITSLGLLMAYLMEATEPAWLIFLFHLLFLFLGGLVCHRRLAISRPSPEFLTEFYIFLSLGGVMGGLFNAIAAPLAFKTVLEYPITMLLVLIFGIPIGAIPSEFSKRKDLFYPCGLGLLCAVIFFALWALGLQTPEQRIVITFGVPLFISFFLIDYPFRFMVGVSAILITGLFLPHFQDRTIYIERSFFGVSRIAQSFDHSFQLLYHGNTLHGKQFTDPQFRRIATAYFSPLGPVGSIFSVFGKTASPAAHVGIVGLGAGTLAAYAGKSQRWSFYEIDPTVIRIAQNPEFFTFLQDSKAASKTFYLGDARLMLGAAASGTFDLLILDAFSSDAPPVHLITKEALKLYLSKLNPKGLLGFNISNRFLDIQPVLAELAVTAGISALAREDLQISPEESLAGKEASQWVILTGNPRIFHEFQLDPRWQPLRRSPDHQVWTDDFSNLLSLFRWN